MEIRILPHNIANMIAAGEVVQRPSSAVKELMENAVDAGATQISVIVKDAGRTLIQVIDNGCGMTPDEAVLCFERHATSKIATAEDLSDIRTFGFRGEALASIAAVADVTLKTRRSCDETGCQVEFSGSTHTDTREISCAAGSNFAVKNLFFNVPARRKFLKSDNVELKHIIEEFTRVALSHESIGFSLVSNDKELYVLKPAKSLKFRIQDLLGKNLAGQIVDLDVRTTVVDILGFIGRPDEAKKTLGNQFMFVNGRYFRSAYLHKAVMNAYENMLPQGATPTYILYLTVDPHKVDVNISPTKTEVKFEDDNIIFQTLFAAIKEALGRNSFGASIDFETKDMAEMPYFSSDFEKFRPEGRAPEVSYDPDFNPFVDLASPSGDNNGEVPAYNPAGSHDNDSAWQGGGYSNASPASGSQGGGYQRQHQDYGKLFESEGGTSHAMADVMVVQGRNILISRPEGLLLVNIRRAWERILYERFLNSLKNGEKVCETTLFPVQVTVGADNRLVFDEHAEMLRKLGFDIAPFGNDTIVVNGLPEGFATDAPSVESAMAEVLIALSENHTALPGLIESATAEKFARMGAAEGRTVTTAEEATRIVDLLFSCSNCEYTINGRKIMTLLSSDILDKLL